jgi:hypothetical protein
MTTPTCLGMHHQTARRHHQFPRGAPPGYRTLGKKGHNEGSAHSGFASCSCCTTCTGTEVAHVVTRACSSPCILHMYTARCTAALRASLRRPATHSLCGLADHSRTSSNTVLQGSCRPLVTKTRLSKRVSVPVSISLHKCTAGPQLLTRSDPARLPVSLSS